MIDIEILSVLIFFFIVASFLIKDRKKIEFKYGVIIRRWEKGKEIIDKFVRKHKKFIKIVGVIAVAISIIASIYVFAFLFQCLVFPELRGKCFAIVLPRVEKIEYPQQLPIIAPRFWPWIISIFLVVIAHESMHAIFIRAEKVKIKNYGLIFLLFLPLGAFVDPNMKQIEKLSFLKRLKIYAAGSFGNFILALTIFLISLATSFIIYQWPRVAYPVGVEIVAINGTPACEVNLTGTITNIDGKHIKNVDELIEFLEKTKPNQNLTIKTTEATFTIQTIQHPEKKGRGYIGILVLGNAFEWKHKIFKKFSDIFFPLLFWIFILNLGIGLANLLPLKPLDGGLIFEEIANKIFKERGGKIAAFVSLLTLFLLILNLWMAIAYYKPPPEIPICKI